MDRRDYESPTLEVLGISYEGALAAVSRGDFTTGDPFDGNTEEVWDL